MSELSEAIEEMRNMRESYDQIGAAAEAYNTGKAELAQNITAKGVQASATETLPELAEKVNTISQETYEINGGEMYAKQLFGSLETPNYWNLYDILAQLLSDGRLVNYGGVLLAEYYKGYDSIALSGAGAGGAYVVSDLDENGQFKMYTNDTTHVWATEEDGRGNRWVAYCFANAGHDFNITDTGTSPRSIFIGRKVGTITLLANSRTSQVVVPDGNELLRYFSNSKQSNWMPRTVIRVSGNANGVIAQRDKIESLYIEAGELTGILLPIGGQFTTDSTLASLIFRCNSIVETDRNVAIFEQYFTAGNIGYINISGVKSCTGSLSFCRWDGSSSQFIRLPILRSLVIEKTEELSIWMGFYDANCVPNMKRIYIGYDTNDRTKAISFITRQGLTAAPYQYVEDVELQEGWCKPLNVSVFDLLTEANMVEHILNRLGDNTGQSAITITIGATNLAKLTDEEKAIATNKGFTLA